MANNFTPGPWFTGHDGFDRNRVWSATKQPIAGVVSHGTQPPDLDPTAQANARLIAAAPDMLNVLREIAERGPNEMTRHAIVALARAAIAKAEGK